jgi:hypothetical protein
MKKDKRGRRRQRKKEDRRAEKDELIREDLEENVVGDEITK